MGRTIPKNAFSRGGSLPHLIHGSLGQRKLTSPKRHIDRFDRFAYTTVRLPVLLNGPHNPKQCPFPLEDLDPI